ncbi:MAG: peptidylprolyl isomerase [Chloroflexi bacterium]|nr:peptidylprolyl isomerase [Chloroflexota bacterium]
MRKHIIILLASVYILVSCSPAPATANPVSLATPTPGQTATPSSIPCTLLHFPVTPEAALGAAFEGRGHVSGAAEAPVTIIVFSDYQCLPCAFLAASLRKIRVTHPNDVRLIYLHAPQANFDKDNLAIQAVEAADLQDKFWEMHDLLFEKLAEWSTLPPADFEAWATAQAADLGMDEARFRSDFEGPVVADHLQQAIQSTAGDRPFAPPLLFVNSASPYTGLADFASLDTVVRMDALTARQFSACPPESIDPLKQYIVILHTTKGDVLLQLYPEKAPQAVNNFVFLARSGWYDGITFYRVLPENRVMTGDPSETGLGNPGYLFETEIAGGLRFDQPGMLAMDNDGPDTNGSRFFITFGSTAQWNGQYTIFGQVLSGLDILSALTPRDPQPGIYLPPGDELISVTIEER